MKLMFVCMTTVAMGIVTMVTGDDGQAVLWNAVEEFMDDLKDTTEISKRGEAAEPIGAPNDLRELTVHGHNIVRANHVDTPPLQWNEGLCQGAQAYALVLANQGGINGKNFRHSKAAENLGENLYFQQGPKRVEMTLDNAMFWWYNEIMDFDYEDMWVYNARGITGVGHFTQMVWAVATHVGCAGASITEHWTTSTYYVCRYNTGNAPGFFHKHVHELKDACTVPATRFYYQLASTNHETKCYVNRHNNRPRPEPTTPAPTKFMCKEKHPAYCQTILPDQCVSPLFGKTNQELCPVKCGVC